MACGKKHVKVKKLKKKAHNEPKPKKPTGKTVYV
jgi:hypothetical protein